MNCISCGMHTKAASGVCRPCQREGYLEAIAALQAELARERVLRMGLQEQIALQQSGGPEIERLHKEVERLREALKAVVHEFESDFAIEGCVVDNPPFSFITAWQTAESALTADNQEQQ